MIAIDTNLLVYAAGAHTPQHGAALVALERARADPQGWGVAFPVLSEFWSVFTGRTTGARPGRPAEAAIFLNELSAAGARSWVSGARH